VWRRDILPYNVFRSSQLRPLDLLDNVQTKAIALHALRLQRSMTSAGWNRPIRKISLHQSRAVTWVRLIGASWLIVATSDSSSSALSLYSVTSLLSSQSRDAVAEVFLNGRVQNGFVQVTGEEGITIVLELQTPS
jgi:hypothetical protein